MLFAIRARSHLSATLPAAARPLQEGPSLAFIISPCIQPTFWPSFADTGIRDTLLRHMSIHSSDGSSVMRDPSSLPSRKRGPQACVPCSKAKQRCQGGIPCARCLRKKLSCYCSTSNFPRRPKIDLIAANEAESALGVGNTGSLTDPTAWQAIEISLPSTPFRASDHPNVDISHSPLPHPLELEPSISESTYPFGTSVVSYHADHIGFGPAQVSNRLNSESPNFDTGDLNFNFDTFSVPFDELTNIDQDLSSQHCIIMPLAHPFMRQTQNTQSNFAFQDSDDHPLLSRISWNGLPSDRSIQKLAFQSCSQATRIFWRWKTSAT